MAVLILNASPRRHGPTATVLRAIVTTSSARLPLNLLSTQSTGAVRVVRTVLGAGGYRIVGVVNVPDMQTHAEVPAVPTCIAPSNSAAGSSRATLPHTPMPPTCSVSVGASCAV